MQPLALTRRGWAFVFAAAGLSVCSRLVGLGDLRYLAALLLAMVLVAVASSLVVSALARFGVRLSVPNPTPTIGEQSTLVVVHHRLPMTLPVRVVWEATAGTTGRKARTSLAVPRASEAVAQTNLVTNTRGPRKVGITALLVPDSLGLVARRVRYQVSAELLVLPRLLEALPDGFEQMTRGAGAGPTHRGRSADSGGPVGTVREYRAGDAMRQVHWKQSARQGELLVKQHDTSDVIQRSILLVTDTAAYLNGAEFETAVSATATVAASWLGHGEPVQLRLGDTPPYLCSSAAEMLRHLATAQMTLEPGRPVSVDVMVTGTVTHQIARQMDSTRTSGTLLATRPAAANAGSRGWRQITISSPGPAARPTSTFAADHAQADVQGGMKAAEHG